MPEHAGTRPWPDVVTAWHRACATDEELRALATAHDTTAFTVHCGQHAVPFGFREGHWAAAAAQPDFEVHYSAQAWQEFTAPEPQPPCHHLFAMLAKRADVSVTGDQLRFAQHAHLVRRVLEIGRLLLSGVDPASGADGASAASRPDESDEPIVGRYRWLRAAGEPTRLYYEESGHGRDLVLLHTAGADARQYHHLMNDDRLRARYRMVAPDLPWHGRSLPPEGRLPGDYTLTTATYAETVVALVRALDLDHPLVLGCSMGGEICLELAYRHPDVFSGVIACEASDHVTGRQVAWSKDPRVNASLFVPEWVYGLMAPQSPARFRREVWWEYSQGGFGTYHGDIAFYSGEWDARERVAGIDTARCPVFMLTGEYDYSCTPEMSRRTAEKIGGARFRAMPGIGHFPMAENPPLFLKHLLPVLDELDARRSPEGGRA